MTLQTRIDRAMDKANTRGLRGGRATLRIPHGKYKLREPLKIDAAWQVVIDWNNSLLECALRRDQPAIQLIGSNFVRMGNLRLIGTGGAGILAARNAKGESAGMHLFENLYVEGDFQHGGICQVASENNTWSTCRVYSTGPGPGVYIANRNPGLAVECGAQTMQVSSFRDCSLHGYGSGPALVLDQSSNGTLSDIHFDGGGIGALARSIVMKVGTSGQLLTVSFSRFRVEADNCPHVIEVEGQGFLTNLTLSGMNTAARGSLLNAEGTVSVLRVNTVWHVAKAGWPLAAIQCGTAIDFDLTGLSAGGNLDKLAARIFGVGATGRVLPADTGTERVEGVEP